MIIMAKQKYLHNLQLLFNPTPREKCQPIVLQKCGVMSRAVKFLTQAFSIQAQKNTNKNVTHILTEQLSLSLRFQQRVHEQACPCVLLSLSS